MKVKILLLAMLSSFATAQTTLDNQMKSYTEKVNSIVSTEKANMKAERFPSREKTPAVIPSPYTLASPMLRLPTAMIPKEPTPLLAVLVADTVPLSHEIGP